MRAAPLPEVFADVGDIGAAGDVLHGFIVKGEDGRAAEGLAVFFGDLDGELGLGSGLIFGGIGADGDVQDAVFGGDDDFAHVGENAGVGDGQGFDEEIGHVFFADVDFLDGGFAFEAEESGGEVDAVGRTDKKQDGGVVSVGVDHQLDLIAGGVFFFVGGDFDVVEAEIFTIEAVATNDEDVAAFDLVVLGVAEGIGEAILAGLGGFDRLRSRALVVGVEVPFLDLGFDGLGLVVVFDFVKHERSGAVDAFAIQGLGLEEVGQSSSVSRGNGPVGRHAGGRTLPSIAACFNCRKNGEAAGSCCTSAPLIGKRRSSSTGRNSASIAAGTTPSASTLPDA